MSQASEERRRRTQGHGAPLPRECHAHRARVRVRVRVRVGVRVRVRVGVGVRVRVRVRVRRLPDFMQSLMSAVEGQHDYSDFAGPGAFNDPDMLVVGLESMAPYGVVRSTAHNP